MPRGLTLVSRLLMWVSTYYVTGILSLEFDDPLSQVPLVWFPSGVAVAAFLCSQRSRWPVLFVALVVTRIFLDDLWRHDLATTLVFSGVGLGAALGIAWVVRRLARPNDDLHAILIWLFATIGICALEALQARQAREASEGAHHPGLGAGSLTLSTTCPTKIPGIP